MYGKELKVLKRNRSTKKK